MDELIYQFLLQAGYPRASIVADPALLEPTTSDREPEDATTFVIVDPASAARLAVIDVVDALDDQALEERTARVGQYARRIGGREIQGFVVRVDPRGRTEADQVRFFRVWPGPATQRLTAKTFPDLDALRVSHLLAHEQRRSPASSTGDATDATARRAERRGGADRDDRGVGAWRYLPAVVLLLLLGADWSLLLTRGVGLLNVGQVLLAVGAASLLTLVAVHRSTD